jgi:6-phosphogluconolactonase
VNPSCLAFDPSVSLLLKGIRILAKNLSRLLLLLATFSVALSATAQNDFFVYAGTYTGFVNIQHGEPWGKSDSKGIYVARFDSATGKLSAPELAAEMPNPSFVAVSPNHKYLYAVSEDPLSLGPAKDQESFVWAFSIDPHTGKLNFLNKVVTAGTSTCYVSVDKTGKWVLTASFGNGTVSVIGTKADGSLGATTSVLQHLGHSGHQTSAHPGSADVSPDNKFVAVSDLGNDKEMLYHFNDKTGELYPLEPFAFSVFEGFGPRHFVFDRSGKHGYLLNELDASVQVFDVNEVKGELKSVQLLAIDPISFTGSNHTAEIALSPNGKFLYESNRRLHKDGQTRGPETIGIFSINPVWGTLSAVDQTETGGAIQPRSFAIDPGGRYLLVAGEVSNNVVVFKMDPETGSLTKSSEVNGFPTPVCLQFVPAS